MDLQSFTKREIAAYEKDALDLVIPHFASNADLAKQPKIFVGGEGCWLYDIYGKKYLDTFASLLTTICGHHRPEIKQAVLEQMNKLEFFPNYHDTFTVPLVELSRKLKQIMPGDLGVSFYVNSGSEANETAMKMARQYHLERGEPRRHKFIARRDSYHATTLGGGAVTGLKWFREYFEPLMPGCLFANAARDRDRPDGVSSAEYGRRCLQQMEKLILDEAPDTIAAMIMDPIPGSNTGFPVPPEGYLPGIRELCDKYGILLIFDEVQTGFGKTGKWFACEHFDCVPDIITIGKGFTGGYIPLGAAVTTPKVAKVFRKKPGTELRSGSTYGGHTVACAATLANIKIIEDNKLVERSAEKGKYIRKELEKLFKFPIVGGVYGLGMLWAVELMGDRKTKKKLPQPGKVGTWIRDYCWDHGMILRNNGDILVMAPALVISDEEIDMMIGMVRDAIPLAMKANNL